MDFDAAMKRNPAPAMVTSMLSRTRYIDEVLLEELATGVRQVVILGAGFDSRAYRFSDRLGGVRLFEVDYGPTQEYKKRRLQEIFGSAPKHVRYVATDFKHLIYVDAFVPEDGDSALDLMPAAVAQMFRSRADTDGDGWRLPAGEAQLDLWGLKPGPAREFVRERLTDFSLRCFAQPARLSDNAASSLPRTYIAAVAEGYPARPVFQRFAEKAQREGWAYLELATGHDCHVEMPDAFAELLVQQASRSHAGAGA